MVKFALADALLAGQGGTDTLESGLNSRIIERDVDKLNILFKDYRAVTITVSVDAEDVYDINIYADGGGLTIYVDGDQWDEYSLYRFIMQNISTWAQELTSRLK